MAELTDTEKRPERAYLVGVQTDKTPKAETECLLNALASAAVAAEDNLFATLDPTTRSLALRSPATWRPCRSGSRR